MIPISRLHIILDQFQDVGGGLHWRDMNHMTQKVFSREPQNNVHILGLLCVYLSIFLWCVNTRSCCSHHKTGFYKPVWNKWSHGSGIELLRTWQCRRFVGVIKFVFHVLQLLPIIFTKQNYCCTSKPIVKHKQIHVEYQTSHYLVMVIGNACLLMP